MGSAIDRAVIESVGSAAYTLAGSAVFFFVYGRRGTRFAHPRSIAYRARPIPFTVPLAAVILFAAPFFFALPRAAAGRAFVVANPWIVAYYAARFGALRQIALVVAVAVALALADHGVGVLTGLAAAFIVDMYWNYRAKKRHILIPG